ncbi:hypothetical protein LEMLEM_LOCUS2566 [Lemmus lemmus]
MDQSCPPGFRCSSTRNRGKSRKDEAAVLFNRVAGDNGGNPLAHCSWSQ